MLTLETRNTLAAVARALAVSKGDMSAARMFLAAQFGTHNPAGEYLARAITDTDALNVNDERLAGLGAYLAAQVSRLSVIGKLSALAPLYRVPADAPVLAQTLEAEAHWTQQAAPIRTSAQAFRPFRLQVLKTAALLLYTLEFLRLLHPNVDAAIMRDAANALARSVDAAFCDPLNEGTPGIEPASPFAGNAIAGTGDIGRDLTALLDGFPDDYAAGLVLIINPLDVPALITLGYGRDATLTARDGGWFGGFMTITSAGIARGSIAAIAPGALGYTETGAFLEWSQHSTIEVTDDEGGSQIVSTWQQNLSALRAILYANWQTLVPETARLVTNAIQA
ncbi:phage major capsid protein [Paraburkholderia aspalathi]|uniref:phage major capsid protein n=1 Tax=Paraburkholderia aspalathi TaxID=1324617 RepID=UPI001B13B633|nr:phage major capsid protein [Paraburkholderia aspalathi]CAE6846090.1 hypothetical protein R20943_07348 [Paraburkholderia aspalathi]